MLRPFIRNFPTKHWKSADDMFFNDLNRHFRHDLNKFFYPSQINRHSFFDDPVFEEHENFINRIQKQFYNDFNNMQRQFIKDFENRIFQNFEEQQAQLKQAEAKALEQQANKSNQTKMAETKSETQTNKSQTAQQSSQSEAKPPQEQSFANKYTNHPTEQQKTQETKTEASKPQPESESQLNTKQNDFAKEQTKESATPSPAPEQSNQKGEIKKTAPQEEKTMGEVFMKNLGNVSDYGRLEEAINGPFRIISQQYGLSMKRGPDGKVYFEEVNSNDVAMKKKDGKVISARKQRYVNNEKDQVISVDEKTLGDKGIKDVKESKYDAKENSEAKENRYLRNLDENTSKDFGDKWNTYSDEVAFMKDHEKFLKLWKEYKQLK